MAAHREFADWYRKASLTPSAELLDARWKGVEAVAASLNGSTLITLLKLYATRPAANVKTPEFLDAAFRKHDASFPSRDNSEEIRVLAGSILRSVIEAGGANAIAPALGIVSCSFGSRRESLQTLDHLRAAELFLGRQGNAVRDVKTVPQVRSAAIPKPKFEELMPTATFAQNAVAPVRDLIVNTFSEQTTRLTQSVSELNVSLWQVIQAQREELNLLWWLQTKVSRDLRVPFHALSKQEASIVLPMELADLTTFLPGPTAIVGLMLAAFEAVSTDTAASSVADAINSVRRAWRETRASALQLPTDAGELFPVLLALSKSLDTDGETEWYPVYKKLCDVKIEENVTQLNLAAQVYGERLFLRSLSEMKK